MWSLNRMNTRRVKRRDSTDDLSDTLNGEHDIYNECSICNGYHATAQERERTSKVKDLMVLLVSPLVVYIAVWLLAMYFDTDLESSWD